jgi:hypothetical protein
VCEIDSGNLIQKPGWIRMSIHPTTSNEEIKLVCEAILELALHHQDWAKDYKYNPNTNEFLHKEAKNLEKEMVNAWFD